MSVLQKVFCFVLLFTGSYSFTDTPTAPPKYVLNLDLPEEQRWTNIVKDYKPLVHDLKTVISKYVPKEAIPLVEKIGSDIDTYLPKPYAGEIRGIAQSINVTLGDVVLCNLLYDISAFCTSIVMQDKNGVIWHARNLDYSFTDILRNITIRIDYQKGGKTVYSGVTYAGYVGLLTAQKPKGFTITVDERDQGAWWMNLLIAIIDRKAVPVSFLVRDVIADSPDYKSAVEKLSYTVTAASAYFIIAGANQTEGQVITKGRYAVIDQYTLDPKNGRWFVVETNYDHWTTPPPTDDRRDPAINAMKSMGQNNITVESLFNVMSTHPVLNNKTTYTVVMSASQPNIMQAWIRHFP